MGIKARFTKADINRLMKQKVAAIERVILNRLILIGEQFVKNARENHTYLDQTGNLTSSISYIVLNNGKTVSKNLEGTAKGIESAKSLISELSVRFQTGYVLIVVAGMDYAAAVESRGKDVLTASSIIAKNELKKAVKDIKRKVNSL